MQIQNTLNNLNGLIKENISEVAQDYEFYFKSEYDGNELSDFFKIEIIKCLNELVILPRVDSFTLFWLEQIDECAYFLELLNDDPSNEEIKEFLESSLIFPLLSESTDTEDLTKEFLTILQDQLLSFFYLHISEDDFSTNSEILYFPKLINDSYKKSICFGKSISVDIPNTFKTDVLRIKEISFSKNRILILNEENEIKLNISNKSFDRNIYSQDKNFELLAFFDRIFDESESFLIPGTTKLNDRLQLIEDLDFMDSLAQTISQKVFWAYDLFELKEIDHGESFLDEYLKNLIKSHLKEDKSTEILDLVSKYSKKKIGQLEKLLSFFPLNI